MHLQTDSVAEPVTKALAVTGSLDRLAGDRVEYLAGNASANHRERCRLGLSHDLVNGARLLAGLTGGEGAGAVRAITVNLGTHVEDDQLTVADLTLAGLGVGERAVGTGSDDRREGGIGPQRTDSRLGGARNIALAAAGETALQAPAPDIVRELGGRADRGELRGVLDAAQLLHHAPRRQRLHPCWEFFLQSLQSPHREVVVFKADPATQVLCNSGKPIALDAHDLPILNLSGGALGVSEIGEEEAQVLATDAGAVGAAKSRQVANVGEVGDQDLVESRLGEQTDEALAPLAHHSPPTPSSRDSSASASR